MSLSFVTKAIQTTTADGVFEEQPVEHDDDGKSGRSNAGSGVGLFEQLRQNKEEEEAERDEFQRNLMRGTLALDEDDAAHLQQLHKQKQAELATKQQQTEMQLASFRAAQADRFERQNEVDQEEVVVPTVFDSTNDIAPQVPKPLKPAFVAPTITIKKRRRRATEDNKKPTKKEDDHHKQTSDTKPNQTTESSAILKECGASTGGSGGLSSLLAGYSSSSDNDNDE
jgi:FAM192A/Fyv6, N-terminal domain